MPKARIIEALGEQELLLPGLATDALAANDRVKYLLTLIQTARSAADGASGAGSLHEERLASGVDDAELDRVIARSAREADGRYRIPRAAALAEDAVRELKQMIAPLRAAGAPAADELARRSEAISRSLEVHGDLIGGEDILALTAGRRTDRADSLHLIVMDAHRELVALQRRIASESIDGASVHGLLAQDRPLVRAFMRGLHATERLRFDHPGLGTLASRTQTALVIQNDLGETDAHVVVARVGGTAVTINYTDVHLQRVVFFQQLTGGGWPVVWEDTRSRSDSAIEGGLYHVASGRLVTREEDELERFLEHLGSRLVFLIDWNRARKRLRRLVGRRGAVELLRWSAEEDYGHMAFLRAGGDGLVYDALEFAGGRPARVGESLKDVLGSAAAHAYMRSVLRICSEGLLAGKPLSLVQDEVRAELTGYLRSARQEMLALALRHAELSVEIAQEARDGLEHAIAGASDRLEAARARAQAAEHQADELVREARDGASRSPDLGPLLELVQAADDIADCAEEAAFYASLLPRGHPAGAVRAHVRRIAQLVLGASREYLRAVQMSAELRRGGARAETDSFLEAVHRTIDLEHETDEAQRAVHQAMVAGGAETGTTQFVVVELTRAFEQAADALMKSAHLLRRHALARVARSEPLGWRPLDAAAQRPAAEPAHPHLYVLGDPSSSVPETRLIGAKANGLARMSRAGLHVPEAVVLDTGFRRSLAPGAAGEESVRAALGQAIGILELRTGLRFGGARAPLLVSVRSGAPASMPGMLETVLNVGVGDACVHGLVALTGNPRLAWDSYRRFVESFAAVVHGAPRAPFEQNLQRALDSGGAAHARELPAGALEQLVRTQLSCFEEQTGVPLPQEPHEQLRSAVSAVLASWDAPKACEYRRARGIPDEPGTAVILQRMVFGNAGGVSGAGVGFTRDPAIGEKRLYLDFLLDAQGEDLVAGRQTAEGAGELALRAPEVLRRIEAMCTTLEAEFGDVQEFEITVQEGALFVLQARRAKRTPWAALQIATDQVHEGLITPARALRRLRDVDLEAIRRVRVEVPAGTQPLCTAIPASVGVASGPLALDRAAAERMASAGTPPVLVRRETLTEDVGAVALSAGVLTAAGGRTSHAAVIARELGKPCLVGCSALEVDLGARSASLAGRRFLEGEEICIDAESGRVFAGSPAIVEERPERALREVARWRGEPASGTAARPALV
jgi:pyruvate, orthophosphate dikinase